MAFTKIAAAGIGSTELVTLHSLEVLNNATVGGVLTYEDVTNVDSIGIITARAGVLVGSGITLSKDGDIFATGISTFTGGINLGDGDATVSALFVGDSIAHTGNTDAKIRFPADDTITAETVNSERLRIDSAGRVLIGGTSAVIASADEFNEIVLTGKTRGAGITLQDTDANTRFQIRTDDAGGDPQTLLNASTNHPIVIRTNNTEVVRIASDGNVGIGTTNPAGNLEIDAASTTDMIMLDVAGTNFARLGHNSASGTNILDVRSEGHTRFLTNGNNERLRIKSDGAINLTSENTTGWLLDAGDNSSSYTAIDDHFPTTNRTLYLNNETTHRSIAFWNKNGSDGYGFGLDNSGNFKVVYGTNERLRIVTQGGQILTGHDTASTNFHDPQTTTDRTPNIQIHGGNSVHASAALVSWNSNTGPYYSNALYLAHSGSSTIGTNSIVSGSNTLGSIVFSGDDGDEFVKGAMIQSRVDGTPGADDMPARLQFFTNGGSDTLSERARIDSNGNFLVGRTTTITIASDPSNACFEQLTDNGMPLTIHCNQTNKRGFGIYYTSGGTPSDFIRCQITTSPKFLVTGNGNTQNANNSYGSISDISLKENIVDANSQWDDIKNIKVRNYNFKESVGHGTHTQIGVVAQEIETVSPKLIQVSDKDGMKNVQYSVLYMKAVKALQEAMTRIETLETEVAALKNS